MTTIPKDLTPITARLAELVAETAYAVWNDEKFRDLIRFEEITSIEQDRIFNELEVSIIALWILHIEHLGKTVGYTSKRKVLTILKKELIISFLEIYRNLQIEENFVKQWQVLIDLRLEEYKHDFGILFHESKAVKELADEAIDFRTLWARIETITFGAVSHIRRGDLHKSDPLLKFIQTWIVTIDNDFGKFCSKLFFQPLGES